MTELLRPATAAARFGISKATLWRWAAAGRIGTALDGGIRFYVAQDIADVIAHSLVPRTIVPISTTSTIADTADEAYVNEFWAGTPAATGGRR